MRLPSPCWVEEAFERPGENVEYLLGFLADVKLNSKSLVNLYKEACLMYNLKLK